MANDIAIRSSETADQAALEAVYRDAFPDEELVPLVRELLGLERDVLSLAGTSESRLVASVFFTKCTIDDQGRDVALLGPLAVLPAWQRKGIGSAIVRNGLKRLASRGIGHVFVLGDPAYYGRLGFAPEHRIVTPYPIPPEWHDAWQSIKIGDAQALEGGTLCVPGPWRRPDLWSP